MSSSPSSTSDVRPSLESVVAAVHTVIGASGFVPAEVAGDDKHDSLLWLGGGEREGLGCNYVSFSSVLSTFPRDLCVITDVVGSLVSYLVHPLSD